MAVVLSWLGVCIRRITDGRALLRSKGGGSLMERDRMCAPLTDLTRTTNLQSRQARYPSPPPSHVDVNILPAAIIFRLEAGSQL